jgi:catechol 2,3-dioxygenase-like lactoylglutathione lyase family enzyme
MQISGIAHIQLSVSDLAKSRAFWRPLFEFFEMQIVFDDETVCYGVGGRTAIALSPARGAERFDQRRVGLHHLCFRLRSRQDVDALHAFLVERGAQVVHPPEDGPWAPGYYSVLCEDPDGIRVEGNFVPGRGNLDPGVSLPKTTPR